MQRGNFFKALDSKSCCFRFRCNGRRNDSLDDISKCSTNETEKLKLSSSKKKRAIEESLIIFETLITAHKREKERERERKREKESEREKERERERKREKYKRKRERENFVVKRL